MGAQPKNKITRAERGKRRQGNTKQITKDPTVSTVPHHKRGIIAQIKQSLGLSSSSPAQKAA